MSEELREALADALAGEPLKLPGQRETAWALRLRLADAVLALPEIAALIADADNWRRATTGNPTEPLPLAMQARDLLVRNRALEAQVTEDSAPAYPPMWVSDVRAALDGDQP